MMAWRTGLRLGRVSNLPTVWTNALAGGVLGAAASGVVHPDQAMAVGGETLLAAVALTCFYIGGMWLNDAFDAEIDARQRSVRPIPSGEISRRAVFLGGAGFLAAGLVLSVPLGGAAFVASVALAVSIVLYDWLHKRTALAPLLMGLTRFLAYAVAALAAGAFIGPALLGAIGLYAWVVGITYAARQEAFDQLGNAWPLAVLGLPLAGALVAAAASSWLALLLWLALAACAGWALRLLFRRAAGDVPAAVVTLIAGISLYDAVLIAAAGAPALASLAVAGFAATLALQRLAPGT